MLIALIRLPGRVGLPAKERQTTTFSGCASPAEGKNTCRGEHVTLTSDPAGSTAATRSSIPASGTAPKSGAAGRPTVPAARPAGRGRPGHCLGICLSGSMNGLRTVTPR